MNAPRKNSWSPKNGQRLNTTEELNRRDMRQELHAIPKANALKTISTIVKQSSQTNQGSYQLGSTFSPLMIELTTCKHKKWFETQKPCKIREVKPISQNLIQVIKSRIKAKIKVTWYEKSHKSQCPTWQGKTLKAN